MKKTTKMVLMLCLVLAGALCHAKGVAGTGNVKEQETYVIVIAKAQHGGTDKSGSITPTVDGQTLTVLFTESMGRVSVEVTTPSGSLVDGTTTITPTGIQIYIPLAGDYVVNFTLPNGDEYYGEFSITD